MSDMDLVIREFNDRGLLWLLESAGNLRDFVRIVADEIAEHLDFTRAERINVLSFPMTCTSRKPISFTGFRFWRVTAKRWSTCSSRTSPLLIR